MLLMPFAEILRRLPRVVLGLVLFGVGIAFMVAGDLGLGPWDVFHQGVSDLAGVRIGTVTVVGASSSCSASFPCARRWGWGRSSTRS